MSEQKVTSELNVCPAFLLLLSAFPSGPPVSPHPPQSPSLHQFSKAALRADCEGGEEGGKVLGGLWERGVLRSGTGSRKQRGAAGDKLNHFCSSAIPSCLSWGLGQKSP